MDRAPKPCSIASMLLPVLLIVLSHASAPAAAEPVYAPAPGGTTHYYNFVVEATKVKRLCVAHNIITVNGMMPGPTLKVRNGDALVINVVNKAKYNVTIHWHGIRQMLTAWADGPEFITQCPIRPGGSYTYRFRVEGQEGTLWWHAHSSWLRATVYGAIVIYPKAGPGVYPFSHKPPQREYPVLLGEWWNGNPVEIVRRAVRTGNAPNISDAFTINGQPGDFYNCSSKSTTIFPVSAVETVLLRVINAALNQELFFSVAGHKMTVVAADASYAKPFTTSFLMLGPGQTTDVLITANQPAARYYMAARAYASAPSVAFDNTTTTAILEYVKPATDPSPTHHSSPRRRQHTLPKPVFPSLPDFNDTAAATAFTTSFRSPHKVNIPGPVDLSLFFTVGLGLVNGRNNTFQPAASINNHSFVLPTNFSILQAHLQGKPGVFSPNLPKFPPFPFNYTDPNLPIALWQPVKGTEVLKVKYGSVVNLVFQGTSILAPENHPMHLHGYDFYVLGMGFGNYNAKKDRSKLNFENPPMRNTVAVPAGGWAVIRFVADNPGAWIMHCHLDVHLTWGLAMVFIVENGVGEWQTLPPPPADLPKCY